jgi:hypothetical protein
MITVFNVDNMGMTQQLVGSKGCSSFSTNEDTDLLVSSGKRKIDLYIWDNQQQCLVHRREIAFPESPKLVSCLASGHGAIIGMSLRRNALCPLLKAINFLFAFSSSSSKFIIGLKRSYEYVNLLPKAASSVSPSLKMMDVSREHNMVALELPGSRLRSPCVLLSSGTLSCNCIHMGLRNSYFESSLF